MPQAGFNWNGDITNFFISYEMTQVREDLCLFVLIIDGEIVIIASLYVDDILIGFRNDEYESAFIAAHKARYDVAVIGVSSTLLVITFDRINKYPEDAYHKTVKLSFL